MFYHSVDVSDTEDHYLARIEFIFQNRSLFDKKETETMLTRDILCWISLGFGVFVDGLCDHV